MVQRKSPVGHSASKTAITQLAGEVTVIVCGFHAFQGRYGASRDGTDTVRPKLFHYRMCGRALVSGVKGGGSGEMCEVDGD